MPFDDAPEPMLAVPRFLEVSHVAHRLSASQEFVRRLIRSKQLKGIRIGKRYRVDPVDFAAFIEAQRKASDLDARVEKAERALDARLGIAPVEASVGGPETDGAVKIQQKPLRAATAAPRR